MNDLYLRLLIYRISTDLGVKLCKIDLGLLSVSVQIKLDLERSHRNIFQYRTQESVKSDIAKASAGKWPERKYNIQRKRCSQTYVLRVLK